MKGKVKWYNVKQGYGFIKGSDGIDVFIHKSKLPFWTIFLNKGDKVEFIKKYTNKGFIVTDIKLLK